ncbi:acyl-CoA dehydrogenase family protein [Amycolatopsis speibonae]|uniref:Acyl-CoA dehydrogenase family protein n=1 Tax=Amycolatopsis speibonae TaxID=1450224 RepID=A0ABV7PAP5_9PSEU
MDFFHETPGQQQLRKSVAALAGRYGLEYYVDKAKRGEDTTEVWEEAGREGFLGVSIPKEYGGQGAGIYELQIVSEEFAAAGCPLLFLPVSAAICATVLVRSGTEEQKRRWLPGFADGSARMTFAVSDPAGGSNLHRIAAHARREGDGWVLSGRKVLVSAVDLCDAMMVVATTEDPVTGKPRMALFIVPPDLPGVSYERVPMALTAATGQFDVVFDEVRLPADGLVGGDTTALRHLFTSGLNPERITFAAWSTGLGRFAIDRAVRYATERSVWNTTLGAHQGLAHPLAEAKINLELARMCVHKAAWLYDNGQDGLGEVANMAKFAAAEAAIKAADRAVQIFGGHGMTEHSGVGIVYSMVRVAHLAPVSREMLLNYVAQNTLGLEKSY